MECIASRGFLLPKDASVLESEPRFNLWQRKLWPYEELMKEDTLYWYETPSRSIVWKSKINIICRFDYQNKQIAKNKLENFFGESIPSEKYFLEAPEQGYCLAFKVKALEKVNLPKPNNFQFPRTGWLRVDSQIAKSWLASPTPTENTTLDELAPVGKLAEQIRELNSVMANVTPERVESIITHTLRKDTKLVRALKQLCNFECQFPNCHTKIRKRNGDYYIEVAHIHPVAKGGRSVIGNLLVLCPNHHKEFDHGSLEISEQTENKIRGIINGKEFDIKFPE